MMLKRYSIAEARNKFTALIRRVEQDTAVELTRRGKPVAMIVSIQHYQQLQAEKIGFWQAFDAFRVKFDLEELDIQPDIFSDLRDDSPGREVTL
jgi:prevent-host-death family protein